MSTEQMRLLSKKDPENGGDLIEYFEKIVEDFHFAVDIKFYYYINNKQKQLVKLAKIPDQYALGLNAEFAVSFNEVYFDHFDDETKNILLSQEIDRIEIDLEKGTVKIGKPTISTSAGIVKKFTYEEVEKASDLERQFEQQLKDQAKNKNI